MSELQQVKHMIAVMDFVDDAFKAKKKEGLEGLANLMGDTIKNLEAITIKAPNGYRTKIDINGYEFDCIVDYEIEPACKGGIVDGMQTEPDTEASISMGDVFILDGIWAIIDIPKSAMKDVLDEIMAEMTE